MSLTMGRGPLAESAADTVNYHIDGPPHRLFFDDFPRRVRALFGDQIVLDTRQGKLLHETGRLPQIYAPESDFRTDLLSPTNHTKSSSVKGGASYWSLQVDGRVAENAVWAYQKPTERVAWLHGYQAIEFEAMDAWFDEDEEIFGHLRDPYHRVDVRQSSRRVRVLVDDQAVADTSRPKVLSETGLPNRYYIPADDVRRELLEPSATHSVCPYKGTASYYALHLNGRRMADVAWYYPQPLENALKAANHLCYLGDAIVLEVDGERLES